MKQIKYIFGIYLLLFTGFVFGQSQPDSLFIKANALYSNQKFEEAINVYEQILASGKESDELYFNLGNAYYKTGNAINAILNYERALLLKPNDEDIKFNLDIANQFIVDNIEGLPKPFFVRWRESVINKFAADTWAKISVVCFVVFLMLLGFYIFSKSANIKRFSFLIGILVIVISLFTFSFASKQKQNITHRASAIIQCPRVTVKSSPSETGTDLFLIHEGLKIEITDSLNNWKEIKLLDGNKGWLTDSCIIRI